MMTIRYADIGSVSSGTLRKVDLLTAFADELDAQLKRQNKSYPRATYRKLLREAYKLNRNSNSDNFSDEVDAVLDELENALGDFAPPYCSFGSHPGDAADFGYWIHDDIQADFDGALVSDLSELPRSHRGEVLLVNDHGNMTLYTVNSRRVLREVWTTV